MKAQNRKEIFLKALANGEEPKIKPLTREEVLLKEQAKRESKSTEGVGGGSNPIIVYCNSGIDEYLYVDEARTQKYDKESFNALNMSNIVLKNGEAFVTGVIIHKYDDYTSVQYSTKLNTERFYTSEFVSEE